MSCVKECACLHWRCSPTVHGATAVHDTLALTSCPTTLHRCTLKLGAELIASLPRNVTGASAACSRGLEFCKRGIRITRFEGLWRCGGVMVWWWGAKGGEEQGRERTCSWQRLAAAKPQLLHAA